MRIEGGIERIRLTEESEHTLGNCTKSIPLFCTCAHFSSVGFALHPSPFLLHYSGKIRQFSFFTFIRWEGRNEGGIEMGRFIYTVTSYKEPVTSKDISHFNYLVVIHYWGHSVRQLKQGVEVEVMKPELYAAASILI